MCDTTGVTSISLRNPDLSPIGKEDSNSHTTHHHHHHHSSHAPSSNTTKSSKHANNNNNNISNDVVAQNVKQNQVGTVLLFGVPIVSLVMDGKERLCLAQISSTLLKDFSYNEIHNRRVALGITCVQCTPVQLEILRRAGAMPVTSRRCGMITRREAERLCQSFLGDHAPPQLPENFAFEVYHECGWGSRGSFVPSRYNSSRAKCIRCTYCQLFFSPNKFIFHSHRLPESRYVQPDAANFNSWRRHLKLCGDPPDEDLSSTTLSMDTTQIVMAWEDVRAMFNGGTRKRMLAAHSVHHHPRSSDGHIHRRPANSGSGGKGSSANSGSTGGGGGSNNCPSRIGTPQQHPLSRHSSNNNNHNNHHQNNSLVNSSISGENSSSITNSSPNSFLSVPSPLLSPSGRIETIWNPGINSSSNPSNSRLGPLSGGTTLPHLPFHPLSIPWLRRPLFPFPHPFAPACHLLADAGMSVQDKLATFSGGARPNQSAFKPVSRNAEHLFTWLNNNNTLANTGSIMGNTVPPSLPEDLSTGGGSHHINHLSINNNIDTNNITAGGGESNNSTRHSHSHSPVSSTNDENGPSLLSSRSNRSRGNVVVSSSRHQIQILSSVIHTDSDNEENVDIESTEVEEECSSTSSIWVTSGLGNNNNNNTISQHGRKRSIDSFSGDDEKLHSSEGDNSPKRKRLWDFGSSESCKKSNEMNHTSTTGDDDEPMSGFDSSKD